jgi:plasmid stability protein
VPVPTLTVRRVDASIARRLRVRAAEQDVSAEELHRRILANALGDGKTVADLVGTLRRMGELGLDLDTPTPAGPEREPPRL